jgi:RNA polymerase sigma-70 factor (ECF subfamily)
MTDAELIVKIKSGDKIAFAVLVNQYSKPVLNTCYRFLLNLEDAEDISQEVFIEIFQSLHSFRGASCYPHGFTALPSANV